VRATAAVWLLLAAGVLAGPPAHAQTAGPGPPGPYAFDLRGATTGLPQARTFYPEFPAGTRIPARGFGFDVGAHVYLFRLGVARVGVGANWIQVRGTTQTLGTTSTSTSSSTSSSTTATATTFPDVATTARIAAPQVSFNFGTHDGWSYLSVGYDTGAITSKGNGSPATSRESSGLTGYNAGGGARWFMSEHLAVGFDLRLHRLGGAGLFSLSAGVSVR